MNLLVALLLAAAPQAGPVFGSPTCEMEAPPSLNCTLVPDSICYYAHVYVRLDDGSIELVPFPHTPCGHMGTQGFYWLSEAVECGRYHVRNGALYSTEVFQDYREVPKFSVYAVYKLPDGQVKYIKIHRR